ncbi:MAG TPA: tetratricopeptide repeat protein [Polyangia bacterium]
MNKQSAISLKDVVAIDPMVLQLGHEFATDLFEAGKYGDVEVIVKGLLAADRKDVRALELYVALLRREGRLRDAVTLLEEAQAWQPSNARVPKLLGDLRAMLP